MNGPMRDFDPRPVYWWSWADARWYFLRVPRYVVPSVWRAA